MVGKKITTASFVFLLIFPSITSTSPTLAPEQGLISIYFADEKVGYEEYIWTSDPEGYTLEARGRIDKPVPLVLDKLLIRVDKNFIPLEFYFSGRVSGYTQEIHSFMKDGFVDNHIYIDGQEHKSTVKIRRDSFLLPHSVFSPYLVLTKKYACSLEEKLELSAYIIPQLEESFVLEPAEEAPCSLLVQFDSTLIELETDETGSLMALAIPSQRIKVIRN